MSTPRTAKAIELMDAFAQRTGLTGAQPPRRYLWTDAFAVCNYLGLSRSTGDPRYTELALHLVDQVHHTLGRHREDDQRRGWISGLDEQEGERHPTRGGLRIGKPLPERRPREPFDERLEWDRDGQYFHYLSKWMHALDQVARHTQQPRFNTWARELADIAWQAFSYQPVPHWEKPRMHWKMSIDLSRPQVASMGQHDPLDGYITSLQLRATAAALPGAPAQPDLEQATRQYAAMLQGSELTSADPLGIGGLLTDALRLQQLIAQDAAADAQLLEKLLEASVAGLHAYARNAELQLPAKYRLAFRELGLAIGLHAAQRLQQQDTRHTQQRALIAPLRTLMQHQSLREMIETFWLDSRQQRAATWLEHQDINSVMLATSLAPDGFLVIPAPG